MSQSEQEKTSMQAIPTDQDVEKLESPKPAVQHRAISGFKWAFVVFSMLCGIFLFSLDNTVLADLVPIIVNQFHRVDQIAWLSVGFTIGAVVLALTFGKLYATFDAKWLYIGSTILFLAASGLCGGAPNMAAEIVGRVLAGIGGNGMYLGTLTLMIVHTLEKERGAYLATIGIVWGLGTVLGPVVGGGFEKVNWRWAFYINPIIGGICLCVCLVFIPRTDPTPQTPLGRRFARLDYIGSTLITGAITSLVMAIDFGGTLFAWENSRTIALFVLAGVLVITFAVQQGFCLFTTVEDRVFPVHLLKNKNAVLLFILTAACNTACFAPIYYIPIYFQFTRGDTALESAVRLLPLIFILSATIFINGQIITRYGCFQDWYLGGSVLTLVGGVLMSRITTGTSTRAIYGFEVLLSIGTGSYVQAGYTTIYAYIAPQDGPVAVSFMSLAQLGGIALGLSLAGAIFVNEAVNGLVPVLPSFDRTQLLQAVSGTSNTFFNGLPSGVRENALTVIVDSLRKIFVLVYTAAAVGLVSSVLLKRVNMGKLMSGQA